MALRGAAQLHLSYTQEKLMSTLFHVVFHFPAELASCCCQRLVIQSNVGVLRSGSDCGLKDY